MPRLSLSLLYGLVTTLTLILTPYRQRKAWLKREKRSVRRASYSVFKAAFCKQASGIFVRDVLKPGHPKHLVVPIASLFELDGPEAQDVTETTL